MHLHPNHAPYVPNPVKWIQNSLHPTTKRLYVIMLLIKILFFFYSHTWIFLSSVLKCAVLAMIKRLKSKDPSPYLHVQGKKKEQQFSDDLYYINGTVNFFLNFRKFKVALNPMYRIFLNFAKSCILNCLSNVNNIKKFHRAVFEI